MSRIILDTNVPAKASVSPNSCPTEELNMQKACMEYVRALTQEKDKKLVLDLGHEIWKEYHNNICDNSNMGKLFFRWLHSYYATILPEDHIKLDRDENGRYIDYPYDDDTREFDESDKKFVALSNAHPEKPPIIEAADGKWLGYEKAFAKYGIHIEFLDRDYAQKMYEQKIISKGV
jgi:hypothetical protein